MPKKTSSFATDDPPKLPADHWGAPNLLSPFPTIVSKKDLPFRLVWYQAQEDGEARWNNAWNKYLEKEYAQRTSWPDTAAILKPMKSTIMLDQGSVLLRDQRIALLRKQRAFAEWLAEKPKTPMFGQTCLLQSFTMNWLFMNDQKQEELILEGAVLAGGDPELKGEYDRKDCPETTTAYLKEDGGRGLVKIFSALFGNIAEPRVPTTEPVLLSHPVFDKLWQLDRPRPSGSSEEYVNIYASYKVHLRTGYLVQSLEGILDAWMGQPRRILPSPKTQLMRDVLKEDRKENTLNNADRQYFHREWSNSVWLCSSCSKRGANASSFLQCSACRAVGLKVLYCDKQCQKADWKFHKVICGKPAAHPPMPTLGSASETQ